MTPRCIRELIQKEMDVEIQFREVGHQDVGDTSLGKV